MEETRFRAIPCLLTAGTLPYYEHASRPGRRGLRMPTIDDEAREELRLTLHVVPGWALSPAGWRAIEGSLIGVRHALERDDRGALFRHLAEIDRAAPARLA